MKQNNSHLLTLIKLMEGHLSAEQGVKVREQFVSDSLLLKRWKKLSEIYENQTPQKENIENDFSAVNPELIASFVEEKMSLNEQEEFELTCWKNKGVLHEVIATYRAVHFDSSSAKISSDISLEIEQTSKRMLDVAFVQCNQADSMQSESKYLQKIEEHSQPNHVSSLLDTFDIAALESLIISPKASTKMPSKQPLIQEEQKKKQIQRWSVIAIAVVAMIAVPLYFVMHRQNEDSKIIPIVKKTPSSQKDISPEEKKSLTPNGVPHIVKTPDNKKEITPSPKRPIENKEDNSSHSLVEKNPPVQMKPKDDEKKFDDLQIVWTRFSGIIGLRTEHPSPWKGILADTTTKNSPRVIATEYLALRTLPSSWLQGAIESGGEMVMDADSEIQVAIRTLQEKKPNAIQTFINLNLLSGKVAFSQLQKGDEILFRNSQQKWKIKIKRNETSLGLIQQEDNTKKIMVFAGEVEVLSSVMNKEFPLQAEQMAVINQRTMTKPEKIIRKQRWLTRRPKPLKLSKKFIKKMNQSDRLLKALFVSSSGTSRKEVLASTRLSFSLNPVASVPRAVSSKQEAQRAAAIQWLIDAKDNNKTGVVWGRINRITRSRQSKVSLSAWFKTAQGKVAMSRKTLSELSTGLGANEPLFVRQCAIHFLRQITRLRLAEYNPNRPTNTAINSVRQKIRRAVSNNRRNP